MSHGNDNHIGSGGPVATTNALLRDIAKVIASGQVREKAIRDNANRLRGILYLLLDDVTETTSERIAAASRPIIIPAETIQAEEPVSTRRNHIKWALWATAIALTGAHLAWVRAGMPGAAAINRALGIN